MVQIPSATPALPASPLGDFLEDTLNEPIAPASSPAGPQVALSRMDTRQAEVEQRPEIRRRRKKKSDFDMDALTTVAAVLCVIYGIARIGSLYYIPRLILSGHVFSLTAILGICSFAITVGIAAAGVGLFTKQTWALPVGSAAAVAYFVLLGISLIMLLVAIVQSGSGLGLHFFGSMISRIVAESIAPCLLIHLNQR